MQQWISCAYSFVRIVCNSISLFYSKPFNKTTICHMVQPILCVPTKSMPALHIDKNTKNSFNLISIAPYNKRGLGIRALNSIVLASHRQRASYPDNNDPKLPFRSQVLYRRKKKISKTAPSATAFRRTPLL